MMPNAFTRVFYFTFLSLTVFLSACVTTSDERADLKTIYEKSAQYHKPDRNPVIVIPGILGSRLVDDATGTTVWGAFRRDYADPGTADGARLIALPLTEGMQHLESQSHYKKTTVHSDGVLQDLKLNFAGIPISIQAYAGILSTLGAGGYVDDTLGLTTLDYGKDHFTCFQFDYDWRQDIPSNAARLETFIEEKREYIQERYKALYGLENAEVKFDIVAHSMGAMLSRYYTRYGAADLETLQAGVVPWTGAEDVERLILVAPPNAGSLEAVEQLVNGFNTGRPLLPFYHEVLIGSFPSVYQLLPRARHSRLVWNGDTSKPVADILDPKFWQEMKWGLSGEDERTDEVLAELLPDIETVEERRKIARDYQAQALDRARLFQDAMDIKARPPDGFEMFLVAGDTLKTASVASVDEVTGAYSTLDYSPGDTTVTRTSALFDERVGQEWGPRLVSPIDWSATMFISGKHRSLTSNHIFEDNVLYWLLEDPRE